MKHIEPVRNWPLVPSRTAVLVVDVQQSECADEALADAPEMAQALRDRMLPALSRLVDGAREAGCEIIYTVIEALTEDGRDRSLDHKLSDILVPRGSPLAHTVPEAGQQDDDIILPKTSSGVFNSTNLTYLLRNMGLDRVIVAGLLTDQCVDMAVRDAADRGYMVSVATDACFAANSQRHATALDAFGGYCWQADTDTICDRLARMGDA